MMKTINKFKRGTTTGYKGYGKGLVCRGFRFKEGATFEEIGEPIPCNNGFHFCENPLDVLDYYPLIDNDGNITEFTQVEAIGDIKIDGNKYCTNKIKIGLKLSLKAFIQGSVDFLFEKSKEVQENTGYYAQLASSGYYAQLASSGYSAQLASSGYSAQLASSGDSARLASSGDSARLASSGDSARLASSGDYAQLASSGDSAQLASSGYYAQLASSGDSARLASSGYYAQLASSGYSARLASSGDSARLASSGDYAQLASSGYYGVIANIGRNGTAKGVVGTWITLAEYNDNGRCICVKSAQIDGEKLKSDIYYKLYNGEFEEII